VYYEVANSLLLAVSLRAPAMGDASLLDAHSAASR
jgi:hypothetical protein